MLKTVLFEEILRSTCVHLQRLKATKHRADSFAQRKQRLFYECTEEICLDNEKCAIKISSENIKGEERERWRDDVMREKHKFALYFSLRLKKFSCFSPCD